MMMVMVEVQVGKLVTCLSFLFYFLLSVDWLSADHIQLYPKVVLKMQVKSRVSPLGMKEIVSLSLCF